MAGYFSAIPDDPSNYDIRTAAEAVYEVAWKTRGNIELGYIPEDSEFQWAVGKTRGEIDQQYNEGGPGEQNLTRLDVIGGPFKTDEQGRYRGSPADWDEMRGYYDWIVEWFEKMSEPLAIMLLEPANQTAAASEALYNSETNVDEADSPRTTAGSAIETWQGTGAVAFKVHVWNRLPNITKTQSAFAMAMAHSLFAGYQAYVEQRKSALDLAKKAKAAIEATVVEASSSLSAELTILAGIATVAAGVFTIPWTGGGSGLAVAAGISTIVVGVATVGAGQASQPVAERKDLPLGSDTVSGVLLNMLDGGTKIKDDLEEAENKIAGAFNEYASQLTNTADPPTNFDEVTYSPRDNLLFPPVGESPLGNANRLLPPPPNTGG